jgi:hypothetical protein
MPGGRPKISQILVGRRTVDPLLFLDDPLRKMQVEGISYTSDHDTAIDQTPIRGRHADRMSVERRRRDPIHDPLHIVRRRVDLLADEAHNELIDGMLRHGVWRLHGAAS